MYKDNVYYHNNNDNSEEENTRHNEYDDGNSKQHAEGAYLRQGNRVT